MAISLIVVCAGDIADPAEEGSLGRWADDCKERLGLLAGDYLRKSECFGMQICNKSCKFVRKSERKSIVHSIP